MNIGESLKRSRQNRGYNQVDFAKLINIHPSYLSQIESGKKTPSFTLLDRISGVLGIPVQIVLFWSLSMEDIPEEKRRVFSIIKPHVDRLIAEVF